MMIMQAADQEQTTVKLNLTAMNLDMKLLILK